MFRVLVLVDVRIGMGVINNSTIGFDMEKDIANVIDEIISGIDCTINGTFNAVSNRFETCQTKWIRIGKIVENANGKKFLITGIETDQWLEFQPVDDEPVMDGLITIPSPFGITGTKINANIEWLKADPDLTKKTPIIWLLEMIRFTTFHRGSSVEFESDLRLFFLDETDVVNYYTMDHRTNVVQPMNKLIDEFLRVIGNNPMFKLVERVDRFTFSRFGVERENGAFQNVLDANLSGVELRFTLTKFKGNCKC
jgi:hypothetical protein